VLKINIKDSSHEPAEQEKKGMAGQEESEDKSGNKPEKIETCYFCLQKFDINKDDLSHYKYGKFPMCDYCSQFYGFYDE
jgi:hypothetical protein